MDRKPNLRAFVQLAVFAIICSLLTGNLSALTHKKRKRSHATNQAVITKVTRRGHHRHFFSPWSEPTYADSTAGDNVDGEDLGVRRAAAEALGPFNGSVVVVD